LNDLLRKQQEKISGVVLERASKIEDGLALRWLNASKVDVPAGPSHQEAKMAA
jgi:hypothetical protein